MVRDFFAPALVVTVTVTRHVPAFMFLRVVPLSWQYLFDVDESLKLVFDFFGTESLLSETMVLLVTLDLAVITFVYLGTTGAGDTSSFNWSIFGVLPELPPDEGVLPELPPEDGEPVERSTTATPFFFADIGVDGSDALDFKLAVFTAATVTE